MSIELMINRLIGQAETGKSEPFSQAESHALSQRLRELVDGRTGEPGPADRGPAAEALELAAYLDGGMDPSERADFERELARSPERREDLIGAAAWLDTLAAQSEAPPADATERLLAMDTPSVRVQRSWRDAVEAFLERLLPRRLAIATSALATVAIAVVGLDLALHLSPLPQPPRVPDLDYSSGPPIRTFGPMDAPNMQALRAAESARILLTAETINALLAYQDNPSEPQRAELLRALNRAGAPAFDISNVRSIAVQPRLSERLRQRAGRLPAAIACSHSLDGVLRVESAD